jgi:hypothetical protein
MCLLQDIAQREYLSKVDPRRRQEKADARMIQEDHTKIANCSEKVVYHTFDAWKYPERLKQY